MNAADTTLSALTPEGIEFTLYPAGLAARCCAGAVDVLIQWTVIFVANIIALFSGGALGYWFILLLMFAVDWFYHVFCEVVCGGQSLGKRLVGLRVVAADGAPVPAPSSMLRNLLRFADGFLLLYHIGITALCASCGFKRLGDHAAGTLVVYTHAARYTLPRTRAGNDCEAVPVPRALTLEEKQALIMLASRYPLLGPSRAGEIAAPWLDALDGGAERTMPDGEYALALARHGTGGA